MEISFPWMMLLLQQIIVERIGMLRHLKLQSHISQGSRFLIRGSLIN